MQLIPEKRAILVTPKNPKRLSKLIPTSKIVSYKGRTVVAVPHRLDETRVLANLGVRVPSPITTRYDWPRNLSLVPEPFRAQVETAGFLTLNSRAFVLNGLGTGKTLAALWAYDYLRRIGRAGKLLVICPLSTMERAWADEIFFHLQHLKHTILYGTRKKRLKLLADESADVYVINHDGAKIIAEHIRERSDITHVVIDEVSQVARNKQTDMWAALNEIVNIHKPKRTVWAMSATPIPNEPTDAFAQVKLVCPERVPKFFGAFRRQVMTQVNQFLWVPKADALDTVDEVMQPAIRFSRDQCVDLPPTIYITRACPLTKDAEKVYKEMRKHLIAEVEAGEIQAVNEAVKVMKLVQIACGVVYGQDRTQFTVNAVPRMQLTADLIQDADGKAIVFVPFVSSVEAVAEFIRDKGYKVGMVHGGVKKPDRDDIFSEFQHGDRCDVIVAQPASMSHGLTLTAASTIIWYAPITSADIYEQANGRITRPGQKNTTVIVNIEGTSEERRMYFRLKNKLAMQDILLERKTDHGA